MGHRCPTYQLHIPLKMLFGHLKSPLQGRAGESRELQCKILVPIKENQNANKEADPGKIEAVN